MKKGDFILGYLSALKKEHEVKKARKRGENISLGHVRQIPVITMSTGLLNTIEGCTWWNHLSRDTYQKIKEEYREVPETIRNQMMFTPKHGERVGRAKWWRVFLQSFLSEKEVARAMVALIKWYRYCITLEVGAQPFKSYQS